MNYLSVIMYLVNAVIFAVMLFLSFINPSLLHCQYWDYILIGLFTAIVFHTGHQTGRSQWFTIHYVSLWLFIFYLVGFITLSFMLIVLFTLLILYLLYFPLGFFMRILFAFMNMGMSAVFCLLILFRFPSLFSYIILFHVVVITF